MEYMEDSYKKVIQKLYGNVDIAPLKLPYEIRTTITNEQHRQFYDFQKAKGRKNKVQNTVLVICGAVFGLLFVIFLFGKFYDLAIQSILIPVLFVIFCAVFAVFAPRFLVRRNKQLHECLFLYRFNENSLTVVVEGKEIKMNLEIGYEKLHSIYEHNAALYLFVMKKGAYIVPRGSMPATDMQKLCDFLRTKLEKKYITLK